MKICILSDIHGNYEALKKCVNEAKKLNINRFFCLGDYVGYYYEPDKCIDLLRKISAVCIKGNHEDMLLNILKDNQKINYYKLKYGKNYKKYLTEKLNHMGKLLKRLKHRLDMLEMYAVKTNI